MAGMDVTGWITGQVFLNTVDESEVQQVTAYLNARGVSTQLMTTNEQMVLDPGQPDQSVTTTSYSVAAQVAGFPQVISPVLAELMQRAHGGGWADEEAPA